MYVCIYKSILEINKFYTATEDNEKFINIETLPKLRKLQTEELNSLRMHQSIKNIRIAIKGFINSYKIQIYEMIPKQTKSVTVF